MTRVCKTQYHLFHLGIWKQESPWAHHMRPEILSFILSPISSVAAYTSAQVNMSVCDYLSNVCISPAYGPRMMNTKLFVFYFQSIANVLWGLIMVLLQRKGSINVSLRIRCVHKKLYEAWYGKWERSIKSNILWKPSGGSFNSLYEGKALWRIKASKPNPKQRFN